MTKFLLRKYNSFFLFGEVEFIFVNTKKRSRLTSLSLFYFFVQRFF